MLNFCSAAVPAVRLLTYSPKNFREHQCLDYIILLVIVNFFRSQWNTYCKILKQILGNLYAELCSVQVPILICWIAALLNHIRVRLESKSLCEPGGSSNICRKCVTKLFTSSELFTTFYNLCFHLYAIVYSYIFCIFVFLYFCRFLKRTYFPLYKHLLVRI